MVFQVFYGGQLYCSENDKKSTGRGTLAKSLKHNSATYAKDLATLSSLTTKLKAENLKEKDKRDSFVLSRLTDEQIDTVKNVAKTNEEM